jgi:hypothetical protein
MQIKIILLLFSIAFVFNTNAQKPLGIRLKNSQLPEPERYFSEFKHDVYTLMNEDEKNMKAGKPLRFAVGDEVDIDLSNQQQQYTISGKNIWRFNIATNFAQGIILTFPEFYIPKGDTLFIYSSNGKIITYYDFASNLSQKVFASKYIEAEDIILEYISDPDQTEKPRIVISNIAKGYRAKDELSCYISVSCSEGDNWQQQKNGVVALLINMQGSWYACSGSLINNARQDETPFILTANHCIASADETTFQTIEFDFFKESTSSDCFDASSTSSLTKTLTGSTLIAHVALNGGSDGALLKLTDSIPDDWNVYYNGIDASGVAADSGVSIHHPAGMVKKISTFKKTLNSTGNFNMDGEIGGENSYWSVEWAPTENGQSVTYGGSSGSSIFNQEGLIVGTLTGGNSYCDSPEAHDYYGKFANHWVGTADTNAFKLYLDPDNSGTLVIKGYDPHGYVFTSKPVALSASDVTAFGFTANWEQLNDTIESYFLSVYHKDNSGKVSYINGFSKKNVGDVLTYSISNLDFSTEYFYSVEAIVGYSVSEPSNEISIVTADATFDYHTPVATDATEINSGGFTANWLLMDDAVSYYLDIYRNNEIIVNSDTVSFNSNSITDRWQSSSTIFVKTQNQYGQAAPSLRLNSGDYIVTPAIDSNGIMMKKIEFWYRGVLTDIYSSITIDYYKNGDWVNYKTFNSLTSSSPGSSMSVPVDSTIEAKQLKIGFETSSGYLVIDDIILTYGNNSYSELLFKDIETGNTNNYVARNLDPLTNYTYYVTGFNGSVSSLKSNYIKVKTLKNTDAIISNKFIYNIFVNETDIIIQSDNINRASNVCLYSISGRVLVNQQMKGNFLAIPKDDLLSGIYLLKIDQEVHKIVIQ